MKPLEIVGLTDDRHDAHKVACGMSDVVIPCSILVKEGRVRTTIESGVDLLFGGGV
jgi:hypothetical protein